LFLRNYYNILAQGAFRALGGYSLPSSFPDVFPDEMKDGSLTLKRHNGYLEKGTLSPGISRLSLLPDDYIGMYSSSYYTSSSSYSTILFGTGDTPVTFEDYKLAEQIPSGTIYSSAYYGENVRINSVTYDEATGKYTADISVHVTNKSGSDITIREFGLGIYYYLFYREVLEEPFTIPAHGVSIFNYQITVTVPRGGV
jgi:hypothetical protein